MKKARDSIDHTMQQLGVELLVMPSDSKINTISSAVGSSRPDYLKTFLDNEEAGWGPLRVSHCNYASRNFGLQR
jgi:hypothetical protein